MKLQILSDLHLEHNPDFAIEFKGENYLILAGDICVFNTKHEKTTGYSTTQHEWFVDLLEHRHVIYIAGNHEYYGTNFDTATHYIQEWSEKVNSDAKHRGYKYSLYYLENDFISVKKDSETYHIIGSTLWTDFDNEDPKTIGISYMMSDYRAIKNITPYKVLNKNKEATEYITEALDTLQGKKIVVTHHGCSHLSTDDKFKGNDGNGLFMSHFDNLVKKSDLWVHGHVHDRFDYYIDNARVIVNPRGYIHEFKQDYTGIIVDI